MSQGSSYRQILKSSSIMGGAAGITMVLTLLRTKAAAVLIGTGGVGLLASLSSIQALVTVIAGLGLQQSAVRDIAAASARDDPAGVTHAAVTVRRLAWLTGATGLLVLLLGAALISELTFGHRGHRAEIVMLGVVVLLSNLATAHLALVQGVRRIGDLARINVLSGLAGTCAALAWYASLGVSGIVPALITLAAVQLVVAQVFAKRIPLGGSAPLWRESARQATGMVRLGVVIMWSSLLSALVTYASTALISHSLGLSAVGLYSAAFALSGVVVNFVLNAMAADYYPRLTAQADDHAAVNRLVNEQTEIGVLLALPGLVFTMTLAPWIVRALYSAEFLPAVPLMHWFLLGCFGRVVSWPLGYVLMALGRSREFLWIETFANALHIALIWLGLSSAGMVGMAFAFFALYVVHLLVIYVLIRRLTGFSWGSGRRVIIARAVAVLAIALVLCLTAPLLLQFVAGCSLTILTLVISTRGIVQRVGYDHRFSRALLKLPLMAALCKPDQGGKP